MTDGLPMSDEAFQRVMLERTANLATAVTQFGAELTAIRAETVPRSEWLQRNAIVDERFQTQGREIGEMRRAEAARRTPWDRVVSIVLAAVALGLVIVFNYAKL
jgi:nitric oxide reductase activation protein